VYNKFNEDGNNIGDAGLLHLSKGTWKKIKRLILSFLFGDWIRVDGYYFLMKGNWKSF
jgi:hypothetical protein